MDATTVAIDLAKDVFQVAVANRAGRILDRQRLTRRQFERFVDTLVEDTDVIMESCGTSHYWGRRMQSRGLRVQLLPVQYVRPYVRRNKTDRADTDALLEAARCGEIRPVPVKTVEQQTLQAIHRVRTQWQTARVARINAMRGLLAEQGHAIPKGARTVLRRVTAILSDPDAAVPEVLCQTIALVVDEVHGLEDEDRRPRSSARTDRPRASRRDAAPDDPGRRRADRDRARGVGRAHSCVSSRARVRQLARIDAAGILDRRATVSGPHQQARRRPSPLSPDARRAVGVTGRLATRRARAGPTDAPAAMGRLDRHASRTAQGHDRGREQTGPDRLGCVALRRRV